MFSVFCCIQSIDLPSNLGSTDEKTYVIFVFLSLCSLLILLIFSPFLLVFPTASLPPMCACACMRVCVCVSLDATFENVIFVFLNMAYLLILVFSSYIHFPTINFYSLGIQCSLYPFSWWGCLFLRVCFWHLFQISSGYSCMHLLLQPLFHYISLFIYFCAAPLLFALLYLCSVTSTRYFNIFSIALSALACSEWLESLCFYVDFRFCFFFLVVWRMSLDFQRELH